MVFALICCVGGDSNRFRNESYLLHFRYNEPECIGGAGCGKDNVIHYTSVFSQIGCPCFWQTVKNFLGRLAEGGLEIGGSAGDGPLGRAKAAIIGPVAAKTAARLGLSVDVMPDEATIPALVAAIIADAGRN